MSKSQRTKGAEGEREAAHLLSDLLGQSVQRILSQTRDSGCDMRVLSTAGNIAVEVKRQEKASLYTWLEQAKESADEGELCAVMWRPNRRGWVVCMPLEEWASLVRESAK